MSAAHDPRAGLYQLPGRRTIWPRRLAVIAVGAALLAVAGWGLTILLRPGVAPPTVRFQIAPPENLSFYFTGDDAAPPEVSPDGRSVVYAARGRDGVTSLWVRRFDTVAAQRLAGTERAQFPFWSPDSRWVAFFSDYKLRKVAIAGGPVQVIAEATDPYGSRGGTWNRDGTIVYAPHFNRPLFRVSAGGGKTEPATRLDSSRRETTHRWPQFLPDGRHFLYFARTAVGGAQAEKNGIYAGALDSNERKFILQAESNAVYVSPGWLLFWRDGNLLAQAFDPRRLELRGQPVAVAGGVEYDPVVWRGVFSVSENGVLIYQAGPEKRGSQLVWYGRDGRQESTPGETLPFNQFRLSPDGKKLAMEVIDPSSQNEGIWVLDFVRGQRTRTSGSAGRSVSPAWSPDGGRVVFGMDNGDERDMYAVPAEGGAQPELLLGSPSRKTPNDWSPDGRYIAYEEYNYVEPQGRTKSNTWILPLFGDRKPFPFMQGTTADVFSASFSPDGKWLAYGVLEENRPSVYVASFPSGRSRQLVSTSGGMYPRWRSDGRELYYLSEEKKVMAVEIRSAAAGLEIGVARPLFQPDLANLADNWYEVSPDGRRFLLSTRGPRGNLPLTVVLNWTSDLRP